MPEDEYPWMKIARTKLGIHEVPGPKADAFIRECLILGTNIGAPDNESDETAWCSAFACRIMELAGLKSPHSAWARSWLKWGKEAEDADMKPGVVVVLERGPKSGHVGFLNDWDDDRVQLLAGNQGDAVSLAWFPQSRVLGWRVPA